MSDLETRLRALRDDLAAPPAAGRQRVLEAARRAFAEAAGGTGEHFDAGPAPRRPRGFRAVALVAAASIVLAGAGLAAVRLTPDAIPVADLERPERTEVISGFTLSLTPVVGDPGGACFVAQAAPGLPRLAGCGPRSQLLAEGAVLAFGVAGQKTIFGVAPNGVTDIELGTSRVDLSDQGFFVAEGRSGQLLTMRRGALVVRAITVR